MWSIDAIADEAREHARRGDLNAALALIADAAANIHYRDPARGEVLSSRILDEAAVAIGRLTRQPRPRRAAPAVIVTSSTVTSAYPAHVLELLGRAENDSFTVLVTNIRDKTGGAERRAGPAANGIDIRFAPRASLALSMCWLQGQLEDLSPERTYLLIDHDDAAAIAACQPELTGTLFFYHHCFRTFTLGAQLSHAVHIDCAATAFHRCADDGRDGSKSAYWPLPAQRSAPATSPRTLPDRPLVTACAGPIGDFETIDMIEPMPYALDYASAVATILAATGGRHVHLGLLSEQMLGRINERILELGLDPARFVYRQGSSSAQRLVRYGVRLFLGGIPRTSLDVLHDAMAAGLPLLLHSNYRSSLLTGEHDAHDGVRSWRTLTELAGQLDASADDVLGRDAELSQSAFSRTYAPDRFLEAVRATIVGASTTLPARPAHRVDTVQNYYDRRRAYREAGATELAPEQPARALLEAVRRQWSERAGSVSLHDTGLRTNIAAGHQLLYVLEAAQGGPCWLELDGWVFGDVRITEIMVEHDGRAVDGFSPVIERPDVVATYPKAQLNCGFKMSWIWLELRDAGHDVTLRFFAGDEYVGDVSHRLDPRWPPLAG